MIVCRSVSQIASLPWRLPLPLGVNDRLSAGKPGAKGEDLPEETAGESVGAGRVARRSGNKEATRARFGGGGREGDWTTVYSCDTIEEAHVVRGALEAEGIPAIVANQAMSHLIGASSMWAVEVRVPTRLEEKAREVIGD